MPDDRRITFIRLNASHDGENLIKSDRKQIVITPGLLNGAIPGFRVEYGGGLERFYPSSNVLSAELEHDSTPDVIAATERMVKLADQLREARANIKMITVEKLRAKLDYAATEVERESKLRDALPRDGQIGKDRKELVDAIGKVERLTAALAELLPVAADKPQEEQPKKGR